MRNGKSLCETLIASTLKNADCLRQHREICMWVAVEGQGKVFCLYVWQGREVRDEADGFLLNCGGQAVVAESREGCFAFLPLGYTLKETSRRRLGVGSSI